MSTAISGSGGGGGGGGGRGGGGGGAAAAAATEEKVLLLGDTAEPDNPGTQQCPQGKSQTQPTALPARVSTNEQNALGPQWQLWLFPNSTYPPRYL